VTSPLPPEQAKSDAPAFIVAPSITAESSSFFPSAVNTAPLPELNSGLSSISLIAASTASIDDPPFSRTSAAAWIDCFNAARYAASVSALIDFRSITPAPPCSTTAHL
jgi:hypothetical protein